MSEPVLTETIHYSDTTNQLLFSNDTEMYACRWPGCNFTAEIPGSISSHYRAHTGKAAQRRRAKRRPHHGQIQNEVLEAALALMDRAGELVDKLDAFDGEFTKVRRELAEAQIKLEEYREREELAEELTDEIRTKAHKYDELMALFKTFRITDAET